MIHKEKAKELVDEFYKCMPLRDTKLTACEEKPELIIEMEKLSAQQCVLKAVDIIIEVLDEISIGESGTTKIDYGQSDWQQVKEEIKKL